MAAAVVPVARATLCLQALLVQVNASEAMGAPFELVFTANVPPLGFSTFLLHPVPHNVRLLHGRSTASASI